MVWKGVAGMDGMACIGLLVQGALRLGLVLYGTAGAARRAVARSGMVRTGEARRVVEWLGRVWQSRHGAARLGQAGRGKDGKEVAWHYYRTNNLLT